MAEYLHPGVYVEEYDSGAVPMQGVSTSTAGFLGIAERGPVSGKPQLVTSFADYKRIYGGYLSEARFGSARYLPYAVEQFFMNGGSRAYIMRADAEGSCAASVVCGALTVTAANPGSWGDRVRVTVGSASKAKTQVLSAEGAVLVLKNADGFNAGDPVEMYDGTTKAYGRVASVLDRTVTLEEAPSIDVADAAVGTPKYIRTCELTVSVRLDDQVETYENVSLDPAASNYIGAVSKKSDIAVITGGSYDAATPFEAVGGSEDPMTAALSGGSDGNVAKIGADSYLGSDNGPGARTGLQAFLESGNVSIMAIPGVTDPTVQAALIAFCENQASCFAILDIPMDLRKTNEVAEFRDMYDSTFAAMYHPWIEMYDAGSRRTAYFPPSGAMAGIYARTDNSRGVHKAPANEIVRGCTGLSCSYNDAEQDILNPIGVNLIRSFTGRGIRVWGARTISSNGLWKYLNVRRLFIYVEQSIKANTDWVVFEPNSEVLWSRVTQTISSFLATCWRDGALAGTTPEQAFFVECGHSTMTQDDIDNGRLICSIGIAPVKPAEFVIFRLTQKTASE